MPSLSSSNALNMELCLLFQFKHSISCVMKMRLSPTVIANRYSVIVSAIVLLPGSAYLILSITCAFITACHRFLGGFWAASRKGTGLRFDTDKMDTCRVQPRLDKQSPQGPRVQYPVKTARVDFRANTTSKVS